jgi:hypothetical protein
MGRVFLEAEQHLYQLMPGRFVEIGTSRNGDDGSTKIIADWANRYSSNGGLTTVDVDPINCALVQSWGLDNVEVVNKTGEAYLANDFPGHIAPISFLYLDNFDWDWHPTRTEEFVKEQQVRYHSLGLEMTNVNSQRAHLAQMMLALPNMARYSMVVCDDTWYESSWAQFFGKSAAVVPLLLNSGYRVISTKAHPDYGTILIRE